MGKKIKRYSLSGGVIEIEDTPQAKEWAKGKGYTEDKAPSESPPPRPATPPPSTE